MFRAQQNPFDEAVGEHCLDTYARNAYANFSPAKATDENLTSENWEYIMVRMVDVYLKSTY